MSRELSRRRCLRWRPPSPSVSHDIDTANKSSHNCFFCRSYERVCSQCDVEMLDTRRPLASATDEQTIVRTAEHRHLHPHARQRLLGQRHTPRAWAQRCGRVLQRVQDDARMRGVDFRHNCITHAVLLCQECMRQVHGQAVPRQRNCCLRLGHHIACSAEH